MTKFLFITSRGIRIVADDREKAKRLALIYHAGHIQDVIGVVKTSSGKKTDHASALNRMFGID